MTSMAPQLFTNNISRSQVVEILRIHFHGNRTRGRNEGPCQSLVLLGRIRIPL